ncbi:hypothetical protein R6Q57_022886 [Mikania cordata]
MHSVHRQRVRKWAILDDESEKWSTNVEEFYLNGDAPFCYSGVFNTPLPLDRSFWGTILGYTCNGYLRPEVIESPIQIHVIAFFIPFLNAWKVCGNVYRRVCRRD